jgi:hypothetical protein
MRAATTLAQLADPRSSEYRLARQALLSYAVSHAIASAPNGNCHAHDLVMRWAALTGEPMPIDVLRQELRVYMFGDASDLRTERTRQRLADEALVLALLNQDVRLVRCARAAR